MNAPLVNSCWLWLACDFKIYGLWQCCCDGLKFNLLGAQLLPLHPNQKMTSWECAIITWHPNIYAAALPHYSANAEVKAWEQNKMPSLKCTSGKSSTLPSPFQNNLSLKLWAGVYMLQ